MWECVHCQYLNDDWESACQRCGAAQEPVADAPAEAAAERTQTVQQPALFADAPLQEAGATDGTVVATPPQPDPVPASTAGRVKPPRKPRQPAKRGGFEFLLVGIIIFALLALGGLGYLAWQRGLLDAWLPGATGTQTAATAPAGTGATGTAGAETALSEEDILEDPLDRVDQARGWSLGKLKTCAKELRRIRGVLSALELPAGEPGALSQQALAVLGQLDQTGQELLKLYGNFETDALRYNSESATELVQLLREEFLARLLEVQEKVGTAYTQDTTGQNPAYVLSDNIPRVLEQYKQVDPAPLREQWQQILHARAQMFLDLQNKDVYDQLDARYQALVEVHNQFSAAMKEVPPYKLRGGTLDKNGITALELYDALASKIEILVVEFAEYQAQLDPDTDSDKRQQLIQQFTDLAQNDHFLAFSETYKLYAQDRELSHVAYENLIDVHFPFVKEHWPAREEAYNAVSVQYENEWKTRWHRE